MHGTSYDAGCIFSHTNEERFWSGTALDHENSGWFLVGTEPDHQDRGWFHSPVNDATDSLLLPQYEGCQSFQND
jgi:hypothetical protein